MFVVGEGFSECTMSGNLMASRIKNTGRLLPTRSHRYELSDCLMPLSWLAIAVAVPLCGAVVHRDQVVETTADGR